MPDDEEAIRNDKSLMKQLKETVKTEGVPVKLDDISKQEESVSQQWLEFGKRLTEAHIERQTGLPPDLA